MKEEIRRLLELNNSASDGIWIEVPIGDYVSKIYTKSTIIPFISEGDLKGFISFYCNDSDRKRAFLSMIIVAKDYRSKGVGKLLFNASLEYLKKLEFKTYSLEVLKNNTVAIEFYTKFGFVVKEDKGQFWLMEFELI